MRKSVVYSDIYFTTHEVDGPAISYFQKFLLKYLTIINTNPMSEVVFTDENFDSEVIESKAPTLVDFWAEWCGPCRILGPIVEQLAGEYATKGVKIGKLNVDECGEIAQRYSIMSIPTLLFFKDGNVVDQIVGVQTKEEISKKLERLII